MARNKELQKQRQREWYERNRERIQDKLRSYAKQRKNVVAAWARVYKVARGCKHCPERDPICLQFHHRNPADKTFTISHAVRYGVRIELVETEAEKCDILCANCHLKLHQDMRARCSRQV